MQEQLPVSINESQSKTQQEPLHSSANTSHVNPASDSKPVNEEDFGDFGDFGNFEETPAES